MSKLDKTTLPIAFFDSGFGGLTVLAEAMLHLPKERWLYYGDRANAPYGNLSRDEVRKLSVDAVQFLDRQGIKALVLACNTATSAAVQLLREMFSFPVIGMEPAVKPALQRGGHVLVMATPLTLKEEKFIALCSRYGTDAAQVTALPCPGLVELVEKGVLGGPEMEKVLSKLFSGVDLSGISVVVLGCTHYLYLKKSLSLFFPAAVEFIDGNQGTVKQLERVLAAAGLLAGGNGLEPKMGLYSSLGPDDTRLIGEFLAIAQELRRH